MDKQEFDAVVVGSGPNGLAAAITLQQQGLSVLIIEAKATVGGGLRTAALTLPGYRHDVCSAVHAMAKTSPFFRTLPLEQYGLEYIEPAIAAAHPFDDGSAAVLTRSLNQTAALLGRDEARYKKIIGPLVAAWPQLKQDLLGPLQWPSSPLGMAGFGLNALPSALHLSKQFTTRQAKGLWAGMAAHSIQPLSNFTTSAIALVLMSTAHAEGWPITKGGSQAIADALAAHFISLGGKIETGHEVTTLSKLPSASAVLFDITPKQLMSIAGGSFSSLYRKQLSRYRYGAGVFKIDWALDAPIPFTSQECRMAGTVHLGNTIEQISEYEKNTCRGKHGEKPFVLLSQPTLFDASRAPEGKHTAWAYCHVPHGSVKDMTASIEKQVERFAPGFQDRILARHTYNTTQMEEYNNNYVGGDINGGVLDIRQLYTRPALRFSPYRTSAKGLYICSSSTPPGGGAHGMCGYHAAKRALKDVFGISLNKLPV